MTGSQPEQDDVGKVANQVADSLDADVLLFNGPIEASLLRRLTGLCRKRRRRANVLLVLVTYGGDADAAYRIAKCLQTKYERFFLFVPGYCKSAGTLVAIGAHELIMSDDGELGPLDVQMAKQDSLWESQSGLTVNAALMALQDKAYLAFEQFFLTTETRSQGQITVRTAGEIATQLTVGLFSPLYAQVDPFHVGEAARAMSVADHYGLRLAERSKSMDQSSLRHLVTHYPAHGFVIDREEAGTIFNSVRAPSDIEQRLADVLETLAETPVHDGNSVVHFLSKEVAVGTVVSTPVVDEEIAKHDGIADLPSQGAFDGRDKAHPRKPINGSPSEPGREPSHGPAPS